ncbi:outer membrane lipoprotein-sorting protein [Dyadobacter fanqingshengii]|uniref:Outer membrane lipoprotein-sorting protein n=1 Tax=Dyadobacter fanqingshengii TaxID=2906443 RepID=A0A9X1TAN6_9BACT|nr:outer membrane lipoprotein-sorting protein [Dyadobacter fanqingshengii]MCF0041104.1 outer membrane lipoprotein-sorting protein [Dyadobacter fanqingshengii]MCF2505787.1 outer membrane lipoprotein-sorting protein [Dyadobacter fanqingshengii]USJ37169.1 outer membrane lipoprotein-sorting protein [Dyadobacter fanqingshengii]
MKTTKMFVAFAAALISAGSFAQTVDEIVDKHVTALGGMDKIKAVNTVITERSLAVQGMEIPTKTVLVVGKSLRNESTVMGNSMVQVVDDSKGWMIRPTQMGGTGEPEDMPADQLKQQIASLDPFGGLVNYKEKGNKVELVGKEKLDKKDVYHLKVTSKEGTTMDEYLDAETYLVSRVKVDMNGQSGEIDLSDYKEVEGVKFPNTMDITNAQMGTMSFITSKVSVNTPVDSAIFKRPVK